MQTAPEHAAARTRTADEDAAIRGLAWSRYGYLAAPGEHIGADTLDRLAARELEDPADRRPLR